MDNLGEALDYAVNGCGLEIDLFLDFFAASGIADRFGRGEPKYVSGMSGTELVMEVLDRVHYQIHRPKPIKDYELTEEYWCGWILARLQWEKGYTFKEIIRSINSAMLARMYPTMHEAPEETAVLAMAKKITDRKEAKRLQTLRLARGYSQSRLASASGVNLRTLQQYETGAKDINKASVKTLEALANAIGCRIEDLGEPIV